LEKFLSQKINKVMSYELRKKKSRLFHRDRDT